MFAQAVLLILVCVISFGRSDFTPVIDTIHFPLNFSLTKNAVCRRHVELFTQSLKNNTLWAYRIWEATAKFPLGLTEGSQYQFGNFDECLSIKEPFVAQYCLTTITIEIQVNKTIQDPFDLEYRPYMNVYEKIDYTNDPNKVPRNKIFWGLCVPDACSPEDIKIELQKYLDGKHNFNIKKYKVELKNTDCQNEQTGYSYSTADYLFCVVIGFFIIITAISTIYSCKYIDKNNYKTINKNKSAKLLLCFSVQENILELGKPEGSNKTFRIFYGLKFILTLYILFAHSLGHIMTGSVLNYNKIEQFNRSFSFMPISMADLMVDIFFLINGLFHTYGFLVQSDYKSYSALGSIILRYFRLVPVYAIITFFYSTLFYKMGSGPLWPKIIGAEKNYCEKNWWTNLLLLNNYISVDNMCILQGWYLGVEFQLFILSIPLNYLIKENNKLCWAIISTVLCGSILVPFLIVYIGEKDPLIYIFKDFLFNLRQNDHAQSVYIPVHTRMSTYILGMIVGFGYYKLRNTNLKLSFVTSMVVFIPALVLSLACLYSGMVFYNPYIPYNALESALFVAFRRPAFAISFGAMIFCWSFGSIPSYVLTWSPLVPLSKLGFSCFLTHYMFQLFKVGWQRTPQTYSIYYLICQVIIELTLSLITALVLFIFIENPCAKFMTEILQKKIVDKSTKTE